MRTFTRLALVLTLSVALPAVADSSVVSSASDGASSSVGGSSTSIEKSSHSSSGDKQVAAGEYRVIEMAEAAERPGLLRTRLQAVAGGDEFVLWLPRAAAERGGVQRGQVVNVAQRPYGLAFAATRAKEPFFLVLEDRWTRELPARPVTL
ncbi:MAG TPA: hypothetical protein VGE47_10355 [Burkholderiaceae bacterium]